MKFRIKKEIDDLENMQSCMQVFDKEIRYSANDIIVSTEKALETAANTNKMIFSRFKTEAENMSGQPLSVLWQNTIKQVANDTFYDKKDISILIEFGNILGSGDVETQIKNINIFNDKLSEKIHLCKEKMDKKGNVASKMGIYVGLLLIIILY